MTTIKYTKRLTGYYVTTHNGVAIALIKQQDGRWTSTYRSPYGCGCIVKSTRRTRALAAADAIAHLDEDAELFA